MAVASDVNLARGLRSLGKIIKKIELLDKAGLHANAESFQERGKIFKGLKVLKFLLRVSFVLIANGMRFC
jgi:hypothetical protein